MVGGKARCYPPARATRVDGEMVMGGLSMREQEVLSKLREGRSNKEIGLMLGISPRTVQKHLQRIFWYLGVQTKAEAIMALYERSSRSQQT